MTRHESLQYLATEAECLAEEARDLSEELRLLRAAGLPVDACATYRQKLQAFTELVANHSIALEWTSRPRLATESRPLLSTESRVVALRLVYRANVLYAVLQRNRPSLFRAQAEKRAG